jgi:predicted DCC family thiol-disulfide oxidoreductase YuxK
MKCLYVLFDADCELCVRCRTWLMQQPAFVPLVFIAFQSDEAQRRFPGIDALEPGEQLLVISDEGAVYRGAHAWIMCLWALENYREHAQRMAHPVLLPFARIVCELLSGNRFFLSDALFRQEPQNTARLLTARHPRRQANCSTTGAPLWKLSLPAAAVSSVRSFAALFPPRAMKS